MIELKIDPEFRDIIQPLTDEENAILSNDICENGCRDPLVIWAEQGVLVDGHNRHRICETFGIEFKTKEMSFADRDSAKLWMIRNQMGRRNLTKFQKADLALEMESIYARMAKQNQIKSGGAVPSKTTEPVDTRESVAKMADVSTNTITKVKAIKTSARPEIVEQVRRGEMSINAAYQTVRPSIGRLPANVTTSVAEEGEGPPQTEMKPVNKFRTVMISSNPARAAETLVNQYSKSYLAKLVTEINRYL